MCRNMSSSDGLELCFSYRERKLCAGKSHFYYLYVSVLETVEDDQTVAQS